MSTVKHCDPIKTHFFLLLCRLDAFLEGFYEIIPKHLISIFNEQELELLISGLPNIDIDDLKNNTEYNKYSRNSIQVGSLKTKFMYITHRCLRCGLHILNSISDRMVLESPARNGQPGPGQVFTIRYRNIKSPAPRICRPRRNERNSKVSDSPRRQIHR